MAVLLLVAGHETTTDFLGNALLALLQNPAELDRLRQHPGDLPAALDELLRFDAPVSTATFRFTTEALTLGDTEIQAGVPVLVALGAANRDPKQFPLPDQLDLGRDTASHLSFGHGIHRCVGAPLAKAEADIALQAVLARFARVRLSIPLDQLDWRRARLVRGLASLPSICNLLAPSQPSHCDYIGWSVFRSGPDVRGGERLGCAGRRRVPWQRRSAGCQGVR